MSRLPTDWMRDRLKDVSAINATSLPADTNPNYEFDYLEISNVDYHGIIDPKAIERLRYEDAPSRARRRVAKNCIMISSVRPNLQAAAFADNGRKDFVCSTGFNVVQPLEHRLSPKFGYYALISEGARQYFEATAKGVGYPAVDDKDFDSFPMPLPPLPEQQRIAAYLDVSCAAIDAAVAAKRRQLETLDSLCSSILLRTVTNGVAEMVETKLTGNEVLPQIPLTWRLARLKSVASIRYGLGQPPAELASGVAMIRATDVDAGTIYAENVLRVDPEALPSDRNPYLKAGEIIVVRSGAYTGDSAIVPRELEGAVAGYDMVVTVTRALPRFVAYCLLSRYVLEGQLLLLTLRAAQPHLNAEELGSILLALPPTREEQVTIVEFLDNKLADVRRIANGIQQQIAMLTTYRKSLIHECVTGQRRIKEADLKHVTAHG
jgi:type I restriction enzyme S subunit